MAIVINGSGTVTGLAVGGLPDGTVDSGTIATGTIVDADINASAAIAGSKLTGVGKVLQVANTKDGALATTTTLMTLNAVPQNTEGAQFISLSFTPTSATSILIIEVGIGYRSYSSDTNIITALFQDAIAGALSSVADYGDTSANCRGQDFFSHKMIAGTTSTISFKVRAGGTDTGTYTFNGIATTNYLGGTAASHITITEIKA
tara:strand:- start:61 stop:672 length:612 start_codon:yes stop_codon:yes gene_type:complete